MTTRRDFLKTTAAAAAATALTHLPAVHAAGSDTIKVGLIGCGGRGTGAGENVLQSAKGVEIVALGDYFRRDERRGVEPCREHLSNFAKDDAKCKELGNKVDLPPERCYTGLDAYKKVIETPGVNYIILATAPGFRHIHLQAAVAAGKNVFTEKPVAVDGPGIRTCLDVYEQANSKNLGIAAGTQRRHQATYLEVIKKLHDGAIGDIVAARCYWNNTGDIWFRKRKPEFATDLDYQMHNWYHFLWLCGDHIVEQHVHNLDVVNWILKAHPLRALGMGGRVAPCHDPREDGNKYNFFAIEYEYPNGVRVQSMCRQCPGVDGNLPGIGGVSEAAVGTKGTCYTTDGRQQNNYLINGQPAVSRELARGFTNPYVQEHTDLIESIRSGKPINELKNVAESTLTAIMGRMSAYTGKAVTWEQALGSRQVLMPEDLTASTLPVGPVPVPGKTPLV
jgi:predicted dehydrogenase